MYFTYTYIICGTYVHHCNEENEESAQKAEGENLLVICFSHVCTRTISSLLVFFVLVSSFLLFYLFYTQEEVVVQIHKHEVKLVLVCGSDCCVQNHVTWKGKGESCKERGQNK